MLTAVGLVFARPWGGPLPAANLPWWGMTDLTRDEVLRYSRHLVMPEVTLDGQTKLKNARVLCCRGRGLGLPAHALPRGGRRRNDRRRRLRHGRSDEHPEADPVRDRRCRPAEARRRPRAALALNPEIEVVPHPIRLTSANVIDLFQKYDIIADGTDNFPTRYLVNDACVLTGKPNVYASIFRFDGQISVFRRAFRPVLSMPIPRAAATRIRSVVRRRRGARRAAGNRRLPPGSRGDQAGPRSRRFPDPAGWSCSTRSRSSFASLRCPRTRIASSAAMRPRSSP